MKQRVRVAHHQTHDRVSERGQSELDLDGLEIQPLEAAITDSNIDGFPEARDFVNAVGLGM